MRNNDKEVIFNFNIKQVNHDLFSNYFNETFHLVHYVSQDFMMSKGMLLITKTNMVK
jgi:hypothetical protein